MSRHIALFNIPAIGHVYPTLAVVAELVRRGHRVSYPAIDRRAELVAATGAAVIPYRSLRPSDTDPGIRPPARDGYISESLLSFLEEADSSLDQIAPALQADPPDLVVYDRMAFAGRAYAAKLGVPSVQLWPMLVSNEIWSMVSLAAFDPTDPVFLTYLSTLDGFLAKHRLTVAPERFLAIEPTRHMSFYPRAFQYRGDAFDDRYAFVGPCLRPLPPEPAWQPPGPQPVLLVTLGTVYNRLPGFYRTCVEAFTGTPWHVVIAVGERLDPAELGPVPDNVEVHQTVPQVSVLRHASVMLCHGGMGGVMEAMSFGVPVLAVPQTLEQEANADRVRELRLGDRLDTEGLTPAAVRDAVLALASDPEVARRVAGMRQQITLAGGATRAADVIEECLPTSA